MEAQKTEGEIDPDIIKFAEENGRILPDSGKFVSEYDNFAGADKKPKPRAETIPRKFSPFELLKKKK